MSLSACTGHHDTLFLSIHCYLFLILMRRIFAAEDEKDARLLGNRCDSHIF